MEKLNLTLTLSGTAVSVREPLDKAEVKSRKGKEVGQSKLSQEIQILGISWDEWHKRCDAAVGILKGTIKPGKGAANTDKRLADAEDQIAELTEKLDNANTALEQLKTELEQKTAELEQIKSDSEQE